MIKFTKASAFVNEDLYLAETMGRKFYKKVVAQRMCVL